MGSSRSYKTEAIVLRKTKLGEKDLIVTMIAANGELMRAVAKGARKPGGSYAARLELFSCVELMLAKGKNLDVVTDAKFAPAFPAQALGLEKSACAAPVAELLCVICQEGLEQPRLYDMTKVAFKALASADDDLAVAVAAAALVKIISSAGFRPALDHCYACGESLELGSESGTVLFSVESGGAACRSCRPFAEGVVVQPSVLMWTKALLFSRFDEIVGLGVDVSTSFSVLHFLMPWIEYHCGRELKSLSYLLTCGLF